MAGAASAHQAATASHEETSQQRAVRTRRTSADPQRAQQGATAAAAAAPAPLDSLSRLQQLADASPRVAQLRRLQALADANYAPVAQLAGGSEEEELVQGKFAAAELQPQLQQAPRANNTGLPDQLKSGIESLSGLSLDHVRVQFNSSQPAQLNALAYAQGSDIHLAPGQERHLPHEAWHVVQQAQGRVHPTLQLKDGVQVNDDVGLEREADLMGSKALEHGHLVVEALRNGAHMPAGAGNVVQRVTLKEAFNAFKSDLTQLATFSNWIQARAGDKLDDWVYLLSCLTLEQLEKTLALYAERAKGEEALKLLTIEDLINQGGDLGKPPDEQVDVLMLSSPHIGEFIAQRQAQGINVAGQVVALDDSAFAERHWQEFLHENQHLNMSPSQKATMKLREMAKVDRVDGFQANSDGKIYMRPTRMGLRVAVHEGVHKYGGHVFEELLGHPLNEGATDYIAILVCAQVGAEIAPEYYPTEKKLLIDLLSVLKISDQKLFAAYFNDEVAPFVNALVARIGAEHAVLFRKAKNSIEAAMAFNNGQKLVQSKK